ncbi:AAA domain-containing protein [Microbispora sp. H10830]|uniref:AAA domain-containing protein n=1 Tax=Microbispora sp. H10830 TaxID=2729109 RepID=UPI001600878D|nr:AAA domain-containing protein [Microbispora sp. H10830]
MSGPRHTSFPIDQLLRAVRLEIAAELRSDGDGEKLSLSEGRRLGHSAERYEYLFSCKAWKEIFSGERLLIRPSRSRDAWASAEVRRMPDGRVKVRTPADLGAGPIQAQVRLDETAGWEAVVERLESAGRAADSVNLTSAGWLMDQGRPRVERCATPERFIRGYRERTLNDGQRQAVEQALGSELTYIWGPPGTGKTDVVAAIAEGTCRQGLRVLFVAPTKVAVDQALERICDLLSDEERFDRGLVQRAGEIELPSLAAKFGEQIDPARIAERLSASLVEQISDVRRRLEAALQDLALHADVATAEERLVILRTDHDRAAQHIALLQQRIQLSHRAIGEIDHEIRSIGLPTGLFAKKKQAKLEQLGRMRWDRQQELVAADNELPLAHAAQSRYATEIAEAERALTAQRSRLRAVPARGPLQDAVDRLRQHLPGLEQELRKIAEVVRGNCMVMGTTVAKAVQSRKLLDSIDVVIIDEAGMVNTPSAWCVAGLAGRRLVIAGDFRQLPAVTRASGDRSSSQEDREHARLWMDRDPFTTAGLVDVTGRALRDDPRLVCLDTQYRMRPAICEVVNVVAYPDAPLRTGREDYGRLPPSPLLSGPLILIDTTSRRLPNPTARYGAHTTNPVHEAVVHELIRGLQYDEVLPARKWTDLAAGERPTDRMAVIAPFKAQVKALRDSLAYRFGQDCDGLVDTVHRFQGSQRPLVVIDTVAGSGDKPGYFYEGLGLSSSTCRLLNVALSRAQDHLVVVADIQFLRAKLNPAGEAAHMLAHLERHAHKLSVDDLVPFRCAADLAGLPEEELARPAFFPADEVPRAIAWDIARARQSIEIYCAFLDPNPVHNWLRHLAPRVQAGVRVTVHTRDQSEDARRKALVEELRTAGCQVATRERMHEKVLILDDTVLWHGSLNLLANTGPTDLMMRITDPGACRRVRHIVERARLERPARPWPQRGFSGARPEGDGEPRPGAVVGGRLYLDVPFEDKDELKRLARAEGMSASWDGRRKLWHVDAGIPRHVVRRWLPPSNA